MVKMSQTVISKTHQLLTCSGATDKNSWLVKKMIREQQNTGNKQDAGNYTKHCGTDSKNLLRN